MVEIEAETSLSYHQIRWCLKEAGVSVDRSKAAIKATQELVRAFTPEEEAVVRDLWETNVGIEKIAARIGCCKQVVHRWLKFQNMRRDRGIVVGMAQTRHFSVEERERIVWDFTLGMKSRDQVAARAGTSRKTLSRILREEGVDIQYWTNRKLSEIAREGFATGKRVVSPRAGRGIATYYHTPFQGRVRMRSRTEAQRAKELDQKGIAWFYEAQRFLLSDSKSYTPDFWITRVPVGQVQGFVNKRAIQAFLQQHDHEIEDVKGWWGDDHPSKGKIVQFVADYPEQDFHILVMKGRAKKEIRL